LWWFRQRRSLFPIEGWWSAPFLPSGASEKMGSNFPTDSCTIEKAHFLKHSPVLRTSVWGILACSNSVALKLREMIITLLAHSNHSLLEP
jgi:hypothetical protein